MTFLQYFFVKQFIQNLYIKTNLELSKLSNWVAHNKLTLNHEKTEYIEFNKSPDKPTNSSFNNLLKIDGKCIRKVDQSKFLGVHIDNKISWRPHIHKIITKVSQTIGIIGRAKTFMNETQLTMLYNTMVLPHLQYCLINWGNFRLDSNVRLRNKLLGLQKCLMRIICNSNRMSHADPLFNRLNALKIDDLYEQTIRMFSYKLSRNMLPQAISSMFTKASHAHNTRNAKSNLFVMHSHRRSIKGIAPKCWNSLPLELKKSPSISSFKSRSKTSYIATYGAFSCQVKHCKSCPS